MVLGVGSLNILLSVSFLSHENFVVVFVVDVVLNVDVVGQLFEVVLLFLLFLLSLLSLFLLFLLFLMLKLLFRQHQRLI